MSTESRINGAVADAVDWGDRKTLAWIFQNHGGKVTEGLEDIYPALIAVAQYGARRAAENAIADSDDAAAT